jgi:hypothetical protein
MGKFIVSQLAGLPDARVVQALQSMGNISQVFYMCDTYSPAQDVYGRFSTFWTNKDLLGSPDQLYEAFYG